MKRGMKRLVSGLLAVVVVLAMFGVNTKTASAEERLTQNYVYDGYEVEFDVTDAWDGAFNADVKIANTGESEICDWALTFEFDHEIQNLWDATVVEHTGNAYVIKNADWNANIKPGEGVAFGMTVLCDGEIAFPENFSFVMEEESVTTQSYSAEFTLYSEWETGCNGAIILSNLTDESIENWQLEFDFDREIVDIANAVIISHEQNHYVIKNTGDNADIEGKSSVHISIVAGEGAADERPENFVMQQTVVGNFETDEEGGSEEIPDDEMDAIIAERLKGVKYKEPEAEHVQYDEATDTYYVDNQVLIVTKDGVTQEEVEALATDFGANVVGYIVLTGDYQLEFQVHTLEELYTVVEQISGNELVEDVMLHEVFETDFFAVPNDPVWNESDIDGWDELYPAGYNWGLEAINAMGAWEYEGIKVNVGIIDTMFDTKHEDLKFVFKKVIENPDDVRECYEEQYSNRSQKANNIAHGTHVAGTIAAQYGNNIGITGVAPNIALYGVAFYNLKSNSDYSTLSSIFKFKYALANLILSNCKVINVSMGNVGLGDEKLEQEAEVYGKFLYTFLERGYDFVIVQAAGNHPFEVKNTGIFVNVDIQEVKDRIIVVSAIGLTNSVSVDNKAYTYYKYFVEKILKKDNLFLGYESYKDGHYGERIDVCAPGVGVFSTVPGNGYSNKCINQSGGLKLWEGTSMAAPHVSGVAAMCFSVNPTLTGKQVKEIICNTASVRVTDIHGYSYPLIDASAAVEEAKDAEGNSSSFAGEAIGIIQGRTYAKVLGDMNAQIIEFPSGVNVVAYRVNSGNFEECVATAKTDSEGMFELFVNKGTYDVIVYSDKYMPLFYSSVIIDSGEVEFLDFRLLPIRECETSNVVTGKIYDALSGEALEGVSIEVSEGYYGIDGIDSSERDNTVYAEVSTDEQGMFSIKLPAGYYTFNLKKGGYISSSVCVLSTSDETSQNVGMTPILDENEYRIVLTWGNVPSDLDSHLLGLNSGEQVFHIYYSQKVYYENGELVAQLDLDDVSGYGPETVTITLVTEEGYDYLYYVYDYTNGRNDSSSYLSLSGARVSVYGGNELIKNYIIPINVEGTNWVVFKIEDGKLIDVNEIHKSTVW